MGVQTSDHSPVELRAVYGKALRHSGMCAMGITGRIWRYEVVIRALTPIHQTGYSVQ